MMALAPLCSYIPLASLAAVLVIVAWNMSEIERIRHLMSAPVGDRLVLLLTLGLTVVIDLTVAIEVGVVLAAILFMHRMAEAVAIENHTTLIDDDIDDFKRNPNDRYTRRSDLPKGVEVFELRGPFFFGVANRLGDVLDRIDNPPQTFVLLMREVPMIDATGARALSDFLARCERHRTQVVLTELRPAVLESLTSMNALPDNTKLAPDFAKLLDELREQTP
jgi:SulP family sulfate permease